MNEVNLNWKRYKAMSNQIYYQDRLSQSGNQPVSVGHSQHQQDIVYQNDHGHTSNVQYVQEDLPVAHYGTTTYANPANIGRKSQTVYTSVQTQPVEIRRSNYAYTEQLIQNSNNQGQGQVLGSHLNQNLNHGAERVYTQGSTNYVVNDPRISSSNVRTVNGPSEVVVSQNQNRQTIIQGSTIVGQDKKSYRQGSERVINETKLPSRVIETRELEGKVVGSNQLQAYEVSRSVLNSSNTKVTQNQLPSKEQRPSITRQVNNKDIQFHSEKAIINQRIVEKFIDVNIDRPVPRYVEKLVPYDVIVERPREVITERDIITEIIVERPYEKIIEVPTQKIVEIPIKKTIERINYVDVHKDVPVRRNVEKRIEHVVETPIVNEKVIEIDEKDIGKYKYDKVLPTDVRVYQQDVVKEVRKTIQNFIEKQVEVPREVIVQNKIQRIIEKPVERIVERPVYHENRIEKIVNVPVEQVVYNKVEQIVEEKEYIDNVIERPVYHERINEVPREIIQERVVDKPVYSERIVNKQVDRYIEKPVKMEREVVIDVPEYVEKPVYIENVIKKSVARYIQQDVYYETIVPIERVTIVEETIPVPIEKIIDRPVERNVEQYVENLIEKEVIEYNIIEDIQYVDKLVNVNIEKRVENPVVRQNIIQKPIYIERIVDKQIPRNIEKIVEVKVDRIIEVPVDVIVEVPTFKERQIYKDVYVNKNVKKSHTNFQQQAVDQNLVAKIESQRKQISETKTRTVRIKAEYQNWVKKENNVTLHTDIDYTSQNQVLKQKIYELELAIRDAQSGKIRKSLYNGSL